MFTPNQERAATEMVRVVRPGGRIGLASWTPDGFIGQVFKVIKHYVPNPLPSPLLWGVPEHVGALFGEYAEITQVNLLDYRFVDTDADTWLSHFKHVYGPMRKAFAAVGETQREAMHADLQQVVEGFSDPAAGGLSIASQYAEIILTKS